MDKPEIHVPCQGHAHVARRQVLHQVSDVSDIPAGEGRVIRRGLHKIAAYKGSDGTVHECSAVCPHLKCIVDWNSAEKSWDCPCCQTVIPAHRNRNKMRLQTPDAPRLHTLHADKPMQAIRTPATHPCRTGTHHRTRGRQEAMGEGGVGTFESLRPLLRQR